MHETMMKLKLEEEMKPLKEICEKLESTIKSQFDCGIENIDTEEMGQVVDMVKDIYEAKEKIAKACYYKQIVCAMEKAEEDEKKEDEFMLQQFKSEYGDDDGKRFYDNWRYADGRFARRGRGTYQPQNSGRRGRRGYEEMIPMDYHMTPEMYHEHDPEWYRDMDREKLGKMYYTETGSTRGNSGNRSDGSMTGTRNYGGSTARSGGGMMGDRGGGRPASRYETAKRGYEETKMAHNGDTPEDKKLTMKEMENVLNVVFDEIDEMLEDTTPEIRSMVKTKGMSRLQKIQ